MLFIPQKCKYTVIRLPHLQIDLCGSVVIHNSDRLRLRAEIAQHIRFAQWKSYACCRKRSAFGECFSGDIARWCADPDKLAARCGEAPQKLQCRCADTGTAADHDPSVAHLPNAERSGLRGIDCGMCGQNALVAIVKSRSASASANGTTAGTAVPAFSWPVRRRPDHLPSRDGSGTRGFRPDVAPASGRPAFPAR